MRIRIPTWIFAGFTALSCLVLATELNTFAFSRALLTTPHPNALSGQRRAVASVQSTQQVLLACDQKMSAPLSQLQPIKILLETAKICADFAERVRRMMPTYGFAYFTLAQSAQHHGDYAKRNNLLGLSQKFSAFEGWLAERRYSLIANQIPGRDTSEFLSQTTDIATLLTTQSGAELLAGFYLHRSETRKDLAAATFGAGTSDQNRFVNQISQKRTSK